MKLSRLALAVALLPAPTLYATELEPYELEPSVVTRATTLNSPVPASVQVISRSDIESSVATNLLDVLRGKAGIQVHDTVGNGSRATFSLRGFGENSVNNTLLLVDGRSLNQPFMAGADFNSVPLSNIERIEIIRGAGTVLYGDQAVGGVINIITREPTKTSAYVEISRGSQDTEAYRGNVFANLGAGFSAYISGESNNSDNYRKHNESNYDNLFTRLKFDHENGWLLYEYQTIDDELKYPGTLSASQKKNDRKQANSTDWNDTKTEVHRFALKQKINDIFSFNFDYSNADQDGVFYSYGSKNQQSVRTDSFNPRLTARFDSSLGLAEVLLGYDQIESDYRAWGSKYDQTRRDWYSSISQGLGKDITLNLGYRTSQVKEDFKNTSKHRDREESTSIGLSWQVTEDIRTFVKREDVLRWANVDENGFTLPSVDFLKPQLGTSWETGIEWRDALQSYQLSAFRLDLDNELLYDSEINNPNSWNGKGANINLDKTRRQGFMLEGMRQVSDDLSVSAQYTLTDARYRAGSFKDKEVAWVSKHMASAQINYTVFERMTAQLEANYTGPRYLSSDDKHEQAKEGGFTVFNAALKYEYKDLVTKLRVNNITGKEYDSHAGLSPFAGPYYYPAAKRVTTVSVGYKF
jgi:iron complex outermembrane receptor protein